jgi:hypothetical protein
MGKLRQLDLPEFACQSASKKLHAETQANRLRPATRRRLHNPVLARSARVFRPPGDQHPELRRHQVQPVAFILADPVQFALAARAGLVVDDDLNPRRRATSHTESPLAIISATIRALSSLLHFRRPMPCSTASVSRYRSAATQTGRSWWIG